MSDDDDRRDDHDDFALERAGSVLIIVAIVMALSVLVLQFMLASIWADHGVAR
jgi:hypothetical protein